MDFSFRLRKKQYLSTFCINVNTIEALTIAFRWIPQRGKCSFGFIIYFVAVTVRRVDGLLLHFTHFTLRSHFVNFSRHLFGDDAVLWLVYFIYIRFHLGSLRLRNNWNFSHNHTRSLFLFFPIFSRSNFWRKLISHDLFVYAMSWLAEHFFARIPLIYVRLFHIISLSKQRWKKLINVSLSAGACPPAFCSLNFYSNLFCHFRSPLFRFQIFFINICPFFCSSRSSQRS